MFPFQKNSPMKGEKSETYKTPKRAQAYKKSPDKTITNAKFNGSGVLTMVRSPSENIESPEMVKTESIDGNKMEVQVADYAILNERKKSYNVRINRSPNLLVRKAY